MKRGLGRGLDALIGSIGGMDESLAEDRVMDIAVGDIDPNPNQPRRKFDEVALSQLAESIKSVGVIQPVIVYSSGGRYTIVAGERRWRASRLAGLSKIPCVVRDYEKTRRLEVSLIENLQRTDLNPIEEAAGIRALMDECGYTQEAVSGRLGCSRPAVANLLRLLTLPEEIIDMIENGILTSGHGRALASLSDEAEQIKLARQAARQGWSVRQMEQAVSRKPKTVREQPVEFSEIERVGREAFGLKVKVSGSLKRGTVTLHYQNPEDLERLFETLSRAFE